MAAKLDQIELLAPAKDAECGKAAIDCGADAVYVGAARFGARADAGNSIEDIAALVDYAHLYWARVYATVNTLLFDKEIPAAIRLVEELYRAGVDGLIIQDAGLLECDLPPIPLIASTQMHNSTPEKVAFLGKVGFRRAILARELDVNQLAAIRRATDIELECFIHGALCVCYSGQCHLSYALGGRSGNRGQCAQPCRKAYSLMDASGKVLVSKKHLLSLRDLSLAGHLRELLDLGVCSFKIEGRLKDRTYVQNVVAHYRQELDQALAETGLRKASSGASYPDFVPDLAKTFNRGYSAYFLHGNGEPVACVDTPKMMGEYLGRVVRLAGRRVELDQPAPLHAGDGICFFDRTGVLTGTTVNHAEGGKTFVPDKADELLPGMEVYRNRDHVFLSRLEKARVERRIGVTLTLCETPEGLSVQAMDEDGVTAETAVACAKQPADKPERAHETIVKQLGKMGGTAFSCDGVAIKTGESYFLPVAVLNELRRSILGELLDARAKARPVQTGGAIRNEVPYPESSLTYLGNALNARAKAFYRRHGVEAIEPAAESGLDMYGRKVMTTRYCLRRQLGWCLRDKASPDLNPPLYLADSDGNKLELRFACDRCEMDIYLADE